MRNKIDGVRQSRSGQHYFAALQRSVVLFLGLAFVVISSAAIGPMASASRPNVIVIITDDQGFGDFGVTGNSILDTPHLDRLASQSVTFERFYVSLPRV